MYTAELKSRCCFNLRLSVKPSSFPLDIRSSIKHSHHRVSIFIIYILNSLIKLFQICQIQWGTCSRLFVTNISNKSQPCKYVHIFQRYKCSQLLWCGFKGRTFCFPNTPAVSPAQRTDSEMIQYSWNQPIKMTGTRNDCVKSLRSSDKCRAGWSIKLFTWSEAEISGCSKAFMASNISFKLNWSERSRLQKHHVLRK